AVATPGKGDALAVIAPRCRDQARRVGALAFQAIDIGEPAADLEGSDRRMVLMLDGDGRAEPLRQQRPGMGSRRRHRLPHPLMRLFEFPEIKHRLAPHTSALPPANAEAVASSSACSGNSISLCALPEGIIGKQFSSAATRQSNSTGRLTEIISLIAPSRSEGLMALNPTQP